MLTDVFSYLLTALTWQGVFLVSWVGIVVTHMALVRSDRESGPEFRPGRIKAVTPGLGVWVLSSAVGIWLSEHPADYPRLSQVAPLVALVLSVVLYAAVLRFGPSVLLRRSSDLRDEVDDLTAARVACHVCERSYVAVEMDVDPTADGAPICNACAETSSAFLGAARAGH
jgi:intracellular sulfur oxidation DsrE/DsrF family protein